jgi:hypothetical protein
VPASHLRKPRLARLDDFIQVLENTILDFNRLSFMPVNNPFNAKHSCLSSPLATVIKILFIAMLGRFGLSYKGSFCHIWLLQTLWLAHARRSGTTLDNVS